MPGLRGLLHSYVPKRLKDFLRVVPVVRSPCGGGLPYEPEVTALMKRIVQPGWMCADVGAHVGIFSQLLAELVGPEGLVVAFEAHPESAAMLRAKVSAGDLARRVRVESLAVSDGSCGRLWLFPGRGRNSAEWNIVGYDVDGNKTTPELEVPATSLDAYFPTGCRLNLVKIDVEGAEAQVLAGMRRILRGERPVVVVEFHDDTGWAGRGELIAAGYALYDMGGTRLDPGRDVRRIYHFLALPLEVQTFGGKPDTQHLES